MKLYRYWAKAAAEKSPEGMPVECFGCSNESVEAALAGFAIMYFAAEHAHLNLLAVRPSNQRRGVGRALIEWLEKSARLAGISSVYLEVRSQNMPARRFYRQLDYVEFEEIRGYYNRLETAVRMKHDLRVANSARWPRWDEIFPV